MTGEIKIGHANVYVALAAAQSEMDSLIKGAINPAYKGEGKPKGTAYADLADVVAAIREPFTSNGLAWFSHMVRLGDNRAAEMDWRTVIIHGVSDTRIECDVPLLVQKNDMQGLKSAITYAKRIGLESLSGLAPEDDDGNAAAKAPPLVDSRPRQEAPPYDPTPHIAVIEAAVTGKALLDAVLQIGSNNGHPAITAARVEKLSVLIKGAQTLDAIEAFKGNFKPDWPSVAADAEARQGELTPPKDADLGKDEIPY